MQAPKNHDRWQSLRPATVLKGFQDEVALPPETRAVARYVDPSAFEQQVLFEQSASEVHRH
jgi:hypothetical protein